LWSKMARKNNICFRMHIKSRPHASNYLWKQINWGNKRVIKFAVHCSHVNYTIQWVHSISFWKWTLSHIKCPCNLARYVQKLHTNTSIEKIENYSTCQYICYVHTCRSAFSSLLSESINGRMTGFIFSGKLFHRITAVETLDWTL
jgi:hypothetical protein